MKSVTNRILKIAMSGPARKSTMTLPIKHSRLIARSYLPRGTPPRVLGLTASRVRGRRLVAKNSSDDLPMMRLTAEEARQILGVTTASSFDEVLQKKNKMINQSGQDQERIMQLEAAYDTVLMESMKARITGQTNVSTSVRYADVPPEPPRRGAQSSQRSATQKAVGLLKMPQLGGSGRGGSAIAVAPPSQQAAIQQSAVFGALGLWSVLQAVLESPDAQMADTAGLQLSLSLAYSIYSLKEFKKMDLGKAVGLSLAGLVVGALLGTLVANWLRVDIVPLGGFQSPGVLCTEFAITTLLLGSLFIV